MPNYTEENYYYSFPRYMFFIAGASKSESTVLLELKQYISLYQVWFSLAEQTVGAGKAMFANPEEKDEFFHKTSWCRYSEKCNNSNCSRAHSLEELRIRPCPFGDYCIERFNRSNLFPDEESNCEHYHTDQDPMVWKKRQIRASCRTGYGFFRCKYSDDYSMSHKQYMRHRSRCYRAHSASEIYPRKCHVEHPIEFDCEHYHPDRMSLEWFRQHRWEKELSRCRRRW